MITYSNRINCMDIKSNRAVVACEIFDELVANVLVEDKFEIRDFFVDFLVNHFGLYQLIEISPADIVVKVYDSLIDEFAKAHPDILEKYGIEAFTDFFKNYKFGDLVEAIEFNPIATIQELTDTLADPYHFLASVTFEHDGISKKGDEIERYNAEYITAEIENRIGEKAKHLRWKAAKLLNIVLVYNKDNYTKPYYTGVINLDIHGNNTYTTDTIEKAIENRLGAEAKHPWEEFGIVTIEIKKV